MRWWWLQVMFVEVTDMMLRKSLTMAKSAKKYDSWKAAQANLFLIPPFCRLQLDYSCHPLAYMPCICAPGVV